MRVSLEEWRLSFFWLEAETNLCVQGSGLCGTAGGQAVPFPPLGALGLSRGGPGPMVHPLPWREGFGSSWLSPLAPALREQWRRGN